MDVVLVIGGTGLQGPTVVNELEGAGKEVICINRSGKHPFGGRAVVCNRDSYAELRQVFRKFSAFSLIDMIPYTARQAALLIEALEGKQPHSTVVSSIDVYQAYNNLHSQGKPVESIQAVPLDESSALRDRLSFQGIEYDKLNVERIYWSYFDGCAILRMPAIYGLPDTSRVSHYFQALIEQRKIVLTRSLADWKFSRSLNLNCAHAIALGSMSEKHEIFNVAEQQHFSEAEWCELIARLMGVEALIGIDNTAPVPFGMNTQQDWIVDSNKIRSILGYTEKYSVEDGLKKVLTELYTHNDSVQSTAKAATD